MKTETVQLRIIRCRRKTIGIRIAGPAEIIVRAPLHMPEYEIRRVVESKRSWIESHLAKAQALKNLPAFSAQEIEEMAQEALEKLPPRVRFWAGRLGITYGRVTVRNQKTRWGSCSSRGNLNFNCLLMRCPDEVIDYVIVHELCHRKELNHSPRFWAEVERALPEYRAALHWLKTEGETLIARIR